MMYNYLNKENQKWFHTIVRVIQHTSEKHINKIETITYSYTVLEFHV